MFRRLCTISIAVAVCFPLTTFAVADSATIRFTFDTAPGGRSGSGPWTSGCFTSLSEPADDGCIATRGKGAVEAVAADGHAGNRALRFPQPGEDTAIIQVPHHDRFNPGTGTVTVSAKIRLSKSQFRHGSNIAQKGVFHGDGGQWKLQVDDGVPSCRLAGTRNGKTHSVIAAAKQKIVPDEWTFLACRRDGATLTLTVGDSVAASVGKANLDIANDEPVLIGGRHRKTGNDQFNGELDDIAVTID